jgi:hypothetical protein
MILEEGEKESGNRDSKAVMGIASNLSKRAGGCRPPCIAYRYRVNWVIDMSINGLSL